MSGAALFILGFWAFIAILFTIICFSGYGKYTNELAELRRLEEENQRINMQRWEAQNKMAEIDLLKWQIALENAKKEAVEAETRVKNE